MIFLIFFVINKYYFYVNKLFFTNIKVSCMKKISLLILIFLLSSTYLVNSQNSVNGHESCSYKKRHSVNQVLNSYFSPNTPNHKFDVLNYKLNLDIRSCFISPYPKSYTGTEVITFLVDTALTAITLNAVNTSIQVDSVGLSAIAFLHSNNILTISLNQSYVPGDTVNVKIYYRHLDVSDGAFYASGGGVFTDCEPEGARKWFPCWDKPSDKAFLELTAKVPANAKLGSNGRLSDSTLTGDSLYYHWISRDPISTYLMVMTGKVNYNLNLVYWHKLSNPADSVPFRFYYNSGENPTTVQNIISDMTTYYSYRFTEYPFEKGGMTTAPASGFYWGGMENQTLITYCPGCWDVWLTSHEFAHQWFGDMITCGTWADIWLNEGFATYCEALYDEHISGYSSYKSAILSDASTYLSSNPGWAMYNPQWAENTPSADTLFNTAVTYDKGGCVLHMLRYVLNDTTLFFSCLKNYATDVRNFKYKNAVTDDFTASICKTSHQDMYWFIDEWVKSPNHPVYANTYSFVQGDSGWVVGFRASQVQTNSVFHKMPIVVRISFASGPDTNIRVMNDVNDQLWNWTFSSQPTQIVFDPNNDIVLKEATLLVGIDPVKRLPFFFSLHQNYPNPFNPTTTIKYDIPQKTLVSLKIYNILGELVSQPVNTVREAGEYSEKVNVTNLASGIYFYELQAGSFRDTKKMVVVK